MSKYMGLFLFNFLLIFIPFSEATLAMSCETPLREVGFSYRFSRLQWDQIDQVLMDSRHHINDPMKIRIRNLLKLGSENTPELLARTLGYESIVYFAPKNLLSSLIRQDAILPLSSVLDPEDRRLTALFIEDFSSKIPRSEWDQISFLPVSKNWKSGSRPLPSAALIFDLSLMNDVESAFSADFRFGKTHSLRENPAEYLYQLLRGRELNQGSWTTSKPVSLDGLKAVIFDEL